MRAVETVPTDGSPEAATRLGSAALAALEGDGPAVLPTGPGDPAPTADLLAPVDDAVAAVVTTTGSTGAPKAVLLPADALRASADATYARVGPPGRWLLALPAHHIAGLQVLLRSGRAGAPAAVMDLREGFRAEAFAEAATRSGAAYTSLVPTQLLRLLDAGGPALDALRRFTAVLLGGAAADPSVLERARAAGVRLVTTYGMSETCGGCVYDGRPLDGVAVTLEEDGRIRLGGATVAAGYRGAVSDADRAAFTRTDSAPTTSARGVRTAASRCSGARTTSSSPAGRRSRRRRSSARCSRRTASARRASSACPIPSGGRGSSPPSWATASTPTTLRAAVAPGLGRATPRSVAVLDALPLRGIGKPDRSAVRAHFGGSERT